MENEETRAGVSSSVQDNLLDEENLVTTISQPFEADCGQLLDMFPAETWERVTSKLMKRPDDLESLSNSSPFFRNLVASQGTIFPFEKVLALVAPTVWKREGLQGLPIKDILNCRAVCSHWNLVVDKLIHEQLQYFEFGSVGRTLHYPLVVNQFLVNYHILRDEDEDKVSLSVANFLCHFERTHPGPQARNPFIWGHVSIKVSHADENDVNHEDYLRDLHWISTMLSKYGSHVYYVELEIMGHGFYERRAMLRHWFSNMPNIKELNIRQEGNIWPIDQGFKFNLEKYRVDDAFPKLKYLEELKTSHIPGPVLNQLIRQNSHISKLTVKCRDPKLQVDYDFFSFQFPNLKLLQLKCDTDQFIERLASPHVQWPLEYLDLSIRHDRLNRCVTHFQAIQDKLASSLVTLHINLYGSQYETQKHVWSFCVSGRLDLPKLRKIKLFVCNVELLGVDFLLPMKDNLEEISLDFELGHSSRRWPTGTLALVQFTGFEERMLKSNIWLLFNKLKRLEVKGIRKFDLKTFRYCYSREDWRKSFYFGSG